MSDEQTPDSPDAANRSEPTTERNLRTRHPSAEQEAKRIKHSNEALRQRTMKRIATVNLLVGRYGHLPNSTKLIAKEMGFTVETVRELRRKAGCPAQRGSGHVDPEAKPTIEFTDEDKPLYTLGWSIIKLFDTLMAYFRVADEHERDDSITEEGDTRSTWVAWRVFLAAAFGLPQEDLIYDQSKPKGVHDQVMPIYPGVTAEGVPRGAAAPPAGASVQEIYEHCTQRKVWPTVQAKIVSLIVGRRGGKSYITAIIGIYLACCRSYKLNLGTKGMVMILARDKEQAGVIRSYVLAFLRAVPQLSGLLLGEPTQKLIELTNGITIEIRAVGEAGTRGYTVVGALLDEIAFWPTDPDSAKQDKKVLRALKPAMLTIKGAMLVMLSSPYAKRGELYESHRNNYGNDEDVRSLVWQADTLSMRPMDDLDVLNEIRTEYSDDPDSANAEFGALFRTDIESIFSKSAIDAVSVGGRVEQAFNARHAYRCFVDPSGGSADSYVAAIAHDEYRTIAGDAKPRRISVLDKVVEWKPKFDPEQVSKEVVQLCRDYRISSVTGDAYAGEWPRDPLKKRGIAYKLSEMTRSELYLALLPLVNSRSTEMLDAIHHKRGVNQFANLERRVGHTGKDSVDHPSGGHDDIANAIAGVLVHSGGSKRVRATW